mgnify:CR=1 FL=1
MPVELIPYLRWRMEDMHPWGIVRKAAEHDPDLIDRVHREVTDSGPLRVSDIAEGNDRTGPWWGLGKAKIALEAIGGELTLAEIAKKYEVHPNMIAGWKRRLTQEAASLFARGASGQDKASETQLKELHAKIGQLTIEADFLKKGLSR